MRIVCDLGDGPAWHKVVRVHGQQADPLYDLACDATVHRYATHTVQTLRGAARWLRGWVTAPSCDGCGP